LISVISINKKAWPSPKYFPILSFPFLSLLSNMSYCKNCKQNGHIMRNSSCPKYYIYLQNKDKPKVKKPGNFGVNAWIRFCAIKRKSSSKPITFETLKSMWYSLTDKEREYYKSADYKVIPPPPFPEHLLLPPPPFPKELLPPPKELLPIIPYKSIEKILNKMPAKSIEKELIEEFQSNVSKLQSILTKLRKLAK